tara:strand:+ start:186 stop:917 length:732 start_codon:yes stop_codon:yes gene_type:complete
MVICTPCLLPVVKAGAVGLTGAFTYSNVRDRTIKKQKKKKTSRLKKKKTNGKMKKKDTSSQSGGSGMTDTAGDYERWLSDLSRQDSDEYGELQGLCDHHLSEGIKISKRKNIPYNVDDIIYIKEMCDKDKTTCHKCRDFMEKADLMPTQEKDESIAPMKYLPPPVPLAARQLNMDKKLSARNSMMVTAAKNRTKAKKLKKRRRSKHLKEALDRRKKRKSRRRTLRRTRSASIGGGKRKRTRRR